MHIIHISYMSYICSFLQVLYLMSRCFVIRRSSKTANHPYPTRSNQRRQMEQIQEQMAEMRAQLTEQMNAQMAQFMEALTNVTKGQMTCEFSSRTPEGMRMKDIMGCLMMYLARLMVTMIRMSLIMWEGTIILSISITGFHPHLRLVCWGEEIIRT